MVKKLMLFITFIVLFVSTSLFAEDKIEMKITKIKGNKELPKLMYVVPWKDIKHPKHEEHKLVLHSLFGDLFDPILPEQSSTLSN